MQLKPETMPVLDRRSDRRGLMLLVAYLVGVVPEKDREKYDSLATSDDNGLGRRCCSRARPTGPGPSHHELPATYGRHSASTVRL